MNVRCATVFILLVMLLDGARAARRVDAHARARDTMARRQERQILERRAVEELDTTELLQLTPGEAMQELRKATDAHGTQLTRLQEQYHGIPVFDSVVTVRADDRGRLSGDAAGTLIQDIDKDLPDLTPILTNDETFEIAINAEGDTSHRDDLNDVSFKQFVYLDNNDKARLVNKVSYSIEGLKTPVYIIDTQNGDILKHWNSFMTIPCCNKRPRTAHLYGGNELMGKTEYGSQPYCLRFTTDDCGICYLENKYVRVVDMMQTKNASLSETAQFQCKQVYGDSVNGAYSPAIDAFHHATVVGQMFEDWYNTTALNDKMIMRVHYGTNLTNAFWNGVNATFGDGDYNYFYPLTSMDIVAHEVGHGVVDQGSSLLYVGESGGINEAFADIMGETTEDYFLSSDFLTGDGIIVDKPYLREFEVPERDNASISHVSNMNDDMDVHHSSGVYRRVWYIIVNDFEVHSRDAFRVFLHANAMYWHYISSFFDASCGLLRAAMDLGIDTMPFAAAFEEVGIDKCNVSSHLFSLNNNKTQRGVTVSDLVSPVFGFSLPPWASRVIVEAITPSGGEIPISVYIGTWEEEELDEANLLATGNSNLLYELDEMTESLNETQMFIKLGPTDFNIYNDVEVTTGYVCADSVSFSNETMLYLLYRYYCFGDG